LVVRRIGGTNFAVCPGAMPDNRKRVIKEKSGLSPA